jgi:hypothetical protein
MRIYRCVLLICLLAIATTATAVDKGGGDLQLIPPDPSSTFTLQDLTNQYPLTTVQVPLYLDTSNDVTYIQNRVGWVSDDLTLVDVVIGEGVSSTATLTIEAQTSTEVQFYISDGGNSLSVGTDPIAYLHFDVLCYGYGATTDVTFIGGDDLNFYISGGLPAAPLREEGAVRTRAEYYLVIYGGHVGANGGCANINWPVTLYQEVPGRLNDAVVTYDDALFEVESVEAAPGLGGGTVEIVSDVDGVLTLDINDNPMIGPSEVVIFNVYFNAIDDTDDTQSFLQITDATRERACGEIMQIWWLWGGSITIPNHTAMADLGEISKYRTSTYYDVPVKMNSNHPINTYKLFVNFPSDDIEFTGVVARAGYVAPIGGVNPGDPDEVLVSNGSGTNYDLSGLTTVFYLRFAPIGSYPAGTQFDLTFDTVAEEPETEIRYWMDLNSYHNADITDLLPGWIRLTNPPPPPPPCCPALYTWNGRGFELENNILAECDGKNVKDAVTDHYLITGNVIQDVDELRFQIREDANAVSTFDNFELIVVDHPKDQRIQVTKDGQIMTANKPFKVLWARDYKGNDITELISTRDEVVYQSLEDGWFDVSVGVLSKKQIADFASYEQDAKEKDKACEQLLSEGLDIKMGKKLKVSIKTADGGWQLISENDARHNPKPQAAMIEPEMIDPNRELVLRYSWVSFYRTDAVEFYASAPYEGELAMPRLWDVVHSETGTALDQVHGVAAARPLKLVAGEVIDLVFDASDLPRVKRGDVRDFVFVVKGKYDEPGTTAGDTPARGWALDANVPNPFNPATTISYSLAKQTRVELSIYDVSGALVRTLVSGEQAGGEKSVTWDGRSDRGNQMASGVYFYRLSTTEFNSTRKMILLK